MSNWLGWLDRFPLLWLILITAGMAGAPFVPQPHLVEKLAMLQAGTLVRPVDIFDLLMHAALLPLLALRLWRLWRRGRA